MHISEEKKILRQEIQKRIDELDDDARRAEGRTLSRVLLKEIPKGSTVCAYFPLKSEVDIQLLLHELITRGDTVYLPVFTNQSMIFRKVTDLTELEPGELRIPEPDESAEVLTSQHVDIMLVPGRAYDANGNRLGRGSGGYDQWISYWQQKNPDTTFWGTCLQCQLVQRVPMEDHDATMDRVCTANEMIIIED